MDYVHIFVSTKPLFVGFTKLINAKLIRPGSLEAFLSHYTRRDINEALLNHQTHFTKEVHGRHRDLRFSARPLGVRNHSSFFRLPDLPCLRCLVHNHCHRSVGIGVESLSVHHCGHSSNVKLTHSWYRSNGVQRGVKHNHAHTNSLHSTSRWCSCHALNKGSIPYMTHDVNIIDDHRAYFPRRVTSLDHIVPAIKGIKTFWELIPRRPASWQTHDKMPDNQQRYKVTFRVLPKWIQYRYS